MQPFFFRLVSSTTLLAAVFLSACSGTSTSSSTDPPDASNRAAPDTDNGGDAAIGFGDASKKDGGVPPPTAGPVAVLNLSYVNNPSDLSTEVTFVLRNSANQRVEKIRSVKLLFGGTEVATWGDLGFCPEWLVFSTSTSPVLTMSVATYDTDDSNSTAFMTCSGGASSGTRGRRPRATRSAIGQGAVTVVVNGVLADATPFVAQAEAPAP